MDHPNLEKWLIEGLKSREPGAFDVIYDRYTPALYGVIKRIVVDDEIAEEVAHDALLKIWEKASTYDPEKGRLFTWMLNIARNLAIDKTRSRRFKEAQKTEPQSDNVYIIDEKNQTEQHPEDIGVRELLEYLKEDQKLVIELLYFKGYTQSEIAGQFDIPLGTVKTRTRSALQKLRKFLNK